MPLNLRVHEVLLEFYIFGKLAYNLNYFVKLCLLLLFFLLFDWVKDLIAIFALLTNYAFVIVIFVPRGAIAAVPLIQL